MSNHPKGKMILPTTNPNRLDLEWYAQECAWMQVELGKLKTENAALREALDRADLALGNLGIGAAAPVRVLARNALRKEAQP